MLERGLSTADAIGDFGPASLMPQALGFWNAHPVTELTYRITNDVPSDAGICLPSGLVPAILHDIRNRLSVALGDAETLRQPALFGIGDRLEALEIAARCTTDLIDRLIQLAQHGTKLPDSSPILDLNARLLDLMPLLQFILPAETTLCLRLATAGLWPVRADPATFDSAILNLAINARDALAGIAGASGFTIRSRNWTQIDAYGEAADYVQVSVGNSGTGMCAEPLGNAAEPFFSAKSSSALGLHQAWRLVEMAGGRMRSRSSPGRGTVVHLLLPRISRPVLAPAGSRQTTPRSPRPEASNSGAEA